jgi:hypothetical protein
LLADEFIVISATGQDDWINRRASAELLHGATASPAYAGTQQLRTDASVALSKLRQYAPAGAQPRLGELYGARAFAALLLASNYCPGFPLRELAGYQPLYGPPLSTEQVLERALVDYDSALAYAADSARILNFVRVGQGRTLLNLGRFAEAASAVTGVPTDYVYRAEYHNPETIGNGLAETSGLFAHASLGPWSVADREGGTGLDFVSARDPRVRTDSLDVRNGITRYGISKYPTVNTPMVVVSGIEARLIEAEAALRANNAAWLTLLNTLRTPGSQTGGVYDPGTGGVAGLAPLADPGTEAGRVDLLFRERAFWLFGTGTRLGDLRRLIRLYGRSSESVFPTGAYPGGGGYGTGTSIPFLPSEEAPFNPAVTGCTSQ